MAQSELHYQKSTNYTTLIHVKEEQSDYSKKNQETKENRKTKLLKRISLERLMDLKIDYAFKQLFGNEKNKDITVVFLNAILQKTGRSRIKDISFANTEAGGEYIDDKQSRLDLVVVTDADEWLDVEIQFTNKYDVIMRSIFYWSSTYLNPLEKGMSYKELRPVIAINILNFDLFSETERFHTFYHLYEDEEKFRLTNVMEFHFIEMGKLIKAWKDDKLDPWNNVLARWLLLLGMVDHRNGKVYDDIFKELEAIAMKDESLNSAFQNWEELSTTQEQRLAYESRLKRILDDEAFQREMELIKRETEQIEKRTEQIRKNAEEIENAAKQKEEVAEHKERESVKRVKEAEEKEKAAEQKIEAFARRLLAEGTDIEYIAQSTGLTNHRIIEIHRDMQN